MLSSGCDRRRGSRHCCSAPPTYDSLGGGPGPGLAGGPGGPEAAAAALAALTAELQQTRRLLFEAQSREQSRLASGSAERDLLQRRNVQVVMDLATTRGCLKVSWAAVVDEAKSVKK